MMPSETKTLLREAKEFFEEDLITEEEYQGIKKNILTRQFHEDIIMIPRQQEPIFPSSIDNSTVIHKKSIDSYRVWIYLLCFYIVVVLILL